jgi:diguanylate cyclase (GGDEF)-like protein
MLTIAALGLAATISLKAFATTQYEEAERLEVQTSLERAKRALHAELEELASKTADRATWDDSQQNLQGNLPSFASKHLTQQALQNAHADAIVLLNLRGDIAAQVTRKTDGGWMVLDPVALSQALSQGRGLARRLPQGGKGLLAVGESLCLVASHPVAPSTYRANSLGFLVMVSVLDDERVRALEEVTMSRMSLAPRQNSDPLFPAAAVTEYQIQGRTFIDDLYGKSEILLTVSTPRTLYQRGLALIYLTNGSFVVLGVLVGLVLLFALQRTALLGLERLTKEVDEVAHRSGRTEVTAEGRDELSTLAKNVNHMIATIRRNEEDLKAHNEKLELVVLERTRQIQHQSMHDKLTGLANRALLKETLLSTLACRTPHDKGPAILFIDLDNFKAINDTMGHAAGDELLRTVARRIQNSVKRQDLVSRVGGDEFIVLLASAASEAEAVGVAERILLGIKEPFRLQLGEAVVGGSIGAALAYGGEPGADELIRRADAAMYKAKNTGKNTIRLYDPSLDEELTEKATLGVNLRQALEEGVIFPEFQPVADLSTGRIVGCEALARWQMPDGSRVSPEKFIPIAEDSGLIVGLGYQILERSCLQVRPWLASSLNGFRLSVNLSPSQVQREDLVSRIADILARTNFPPQNLQLEVTESILLGNEEVVLRKLKSLKVLGVSLALDDFGTGFSSLSSLSGYPIDVVKVDRSFVSRITVDADAMAVSAAIVALATTLGMHCCAEGIERQDQAKRLAGLGCEFGQGWHFGKALGAEEFSQLLGSRAA